MKKSRIEIFVVTFLALAVYFVLWLVAITHAAPLSLSWDAVTTGTDGQPLGPGLEVRGYNVYSCGAGLGSCTLATATKVGTVTAPAVQFDISAEPIPLVYIVTAFNAAGESAASIPYKVVKPDVPKNPALK